MKNNFKFYIIAWIILLAIFNVICFATPSSIVIDNTTYTKYDSAFWTGYGFIMTAFIGQLVCAKLAFKAARLEKLFLNIPMITISYTGLIVMFVIGGLSMAIPNLPYWVGMVVCVLVLGFTAIGVVKATAASELIEEVGTKTKTKTAHMKSFKVDVENLIGHANSEEIRELCNKVNEVVKYSDPVSSEQLALDEAKITVKFDEFKKAVEDDDIELSKALGEQLITLVEDRNRKCKALK